MQTPGRQVEPQTPMIAINRRVDMTLERLTQVEEDVVKIERPQKRILGSVISQFQTINNSMKEMRDLIDQDIKEKKKYYREETKILRKDSRNLQSLNMGFGRKLAAGALGLYGLSQLREGNLGEGAAGLGGAAALLTPEILGVISTVVTTSLVKRGLLGRGAGMGTMGSRVAGASKLKNPLLITAALAASFILPGLVNANQNADRRRQLGATRVIRGRETINKPDVERFRGILTRFDGILSNISLERRRKGKDTIEEDILDELDNDKDKDKDKNDDNNDDNNDNGLGEMINNLLFPITADDIPDEEQFNQVGPFKLPKSLELDDLLRFQGIEPPPKNKDVSSTTNILGDNNFTANVNNKFQNAGDNLISMNLLESNAELPSSNLENISIKMMGDRLRDTVVSDGGTQVINVESENNQTDPIFSGKSAKPVFVSVGTKFASIPKFESASALRTWGAFV